MFSDDRVSPPKVNEKYREMRAHGVKMRQLVQEGNEYQIGPLSEYRYLPAHNFINRVTLIYGNRITNETNDTCRAIVKIDPLNAEIQRNLFDLLWNVLPEPERSIADVKF